MTPHTMIGGGLRHASENGPVVRDADPTEPCERDGGTGVL